MATIDNELLIRIKGDVTSAKKAFGEVEKSLGQIGEASSASAKKVTSGFGATRRGVESISASLVGIRNLFLQVQAAQAAFAVARGLPAVIDSYNAFTARLRLAVEGQRAFAAALENVTRIANANQASIESVGKLYARLSQATESLGASQSDVAKITEAVALSLRISGASAQESSSAILQLAQAFGSGVLRGDEFNSVNEAAPRLMQALADSLGRPVGELRAMAENGQLTADVVGNALPKALAQLRTEAAGIPPTIGGAFQVLRNNLSQTIGQIDKATGFSKTLSGAILAMSENLGLAAIAVAALGTAFVALGAKVAAGAGLAGTAAVLGGITSALLGPVGLVAALLAGAAAWLSFQTTGTQSAKEVADKFRELNKARREAARVTGGAAFDPKNDPLAIAVEKQRQNVETARANLNKLEKLSASIDFGAAARKALPEAREILALNVQALEEAKKALVEAQKPVKLTPKAKSVDVAKAEAGIKTRLDIENTYQQQRKSLVAAYDAAIAKASSETARAGLIKDRDEALKILDDAKAAKTAVKPPKTPRIQSARDPSEAAARRAAEEAARARLELEETLAAQAQRLQADGITRELAQDKALYEQKTLTAEAYYARLVERQQALSDLEIAGLERQRDAAAKAAATAPVGSAEQLRATGEVAKLNTDIAIAQAALADLKREAAAGLSQAQADALRAQFEALNKQLDAAFAQLREREQELSDRVSLGAPQAAAEAAINAARRETLATTTELVDKMRALAAANPAVFGAEAQAQINQYNARFRELTVVVDSVADRINSTVSTAFEKLFADIGSGAATAADALRGFLRSIVAEVNAVVAKNLSQQILGAILPQGQAGQAGGLGGFVSGLLSGGAGKTGAQPGSSPTAPVYTREVATPGIAGEGQTGGLFDRIASGFAGLFDNLKTLLSNLAGGLGKAFSSLFSGLGGGGGGSFFGSLLSGVGKLFGFASGGYVSGPGTATSDSIPARLSAGEYVIRAAAVRQFGVGFLDAINGLKRAPRVIGAGSLAFAAGGLVPAAAQQAAPQQAIQIVNSLDESVTLNHMQSAAGVRVILNTISSNPRAVRAALGG